MQFRILGPVGLWSGEDERTLRGAKQRTILAALLLARGRVLSDHHIGEMLWGKHPPETYQAQIYTYASRLRQRLADSVDITRKGSGYRMRLLNATLDYAEFEALASAGHAALKDNDHERA